MTIRIETAVACPAADGVTLATDIYRPDDDATHPVLLCRTPYGRTRAQYVEIATALAEKGYIAAVQDVRGRYGSGGTYAWNHYPEGKVVEAQDGYAAVEWCARLPGSDGQVGTWGNSYCGWLSWVLASAQPPSLVGIFASGINTRHTDVNFGVFEIGRRLQWMYVQAADARRRDGDPFGPHTGPEATYLWHWMERGKWLWHTPLETIPDAVYGSMTPMLKHWYKVQHIDPWALDELHEKVQVPTCLMTGWWDRFNDGVEHFTGMREKGPEELRDAHRLIIGPWTHAMVTAASRKKDLGPNGAYEDVEDSAYPDLVDDFYAPLTGRAPTQTNAAPVSAYLLNRNEWVGLRDWPDDSAQDLRLYLGGGAANTPLGNGTLSPTPPESQSPDSYTYDPADPVMSLMSDDAQPAPRDQSPLGRRQDILVYQTEPLERDVTVAGPVSATLHVASDCPETDFVARLIEVTPDGVATNLTYGILRTRYLEGFDKVVTLKPGKVYEITVRMRHTGIVFRKGSRIRLDVTSSDFPNFDRNHNTGRDFWSDGELRVAHQQLFHDAVHPSCLVLKTVALD